MIIRMKAWLNKFFEVAMWLSLGLVRREEIRMISTEISILGALLLLAVVSKLVLSFTKELDEGETRFIRAKNLALYIGFVMMSVSTGCLYTMFFKAYLNPDKVTVVMINIFGEADVELVILSLMAPCVGYFFYHIRKYRKNLSVTWKKMDEMK